MPAYNSISVEKLARLIGTPSGPAIIDLTPGEGLIPGSVRRSMDDLTGWVADVLDQCAVMGDLHHAIAAGAMSCRDVHAELAELVAGARRGRSSAEQVTIFDSTGTALEDVACAARIYRKARARGGLPAVMLDAAA